VVLILYGFMSGSNEDLFWSLFAFSAVIFLLPYQGMLMAFVRMRLIDPDHARPYRIPGGNFVAAVLAGTCMLVLALAIILFMYTPEEGWQLPVVGGVIFMLVLGEFIIKFSEKHNPSLSQAEQKKSY